MRKLFHRRKKKPAQQQCDVYVGRTYVLGDGDPFTTVKVKVLDVKNGWVKYKYLGGLFHWRTMKVRDFLSIYSLYRG